jgi:hypothetical protein
MDIQCSKGDCVHIDNDLCNCGHSDKSEIDICLNNDWTWTCSEYRSIKGRRIEPINKYHDMYFFD